MSWKDIKALLAVTDTSAQNAIPSGNTATLRGNFGKLIIALTAAQNSYIDTLDQNNLICGRKANTYLTGMHHVYGAYRFFSERAA